MVVLIAKGLFSCTMKDITSPAIVLRIREFGESDLLVTFFTPGRGQVRGVAKAARKSRKRFVHCLDTFSLVSLEFGMRKGGDLSFIHSGRLIDGFPGLRKDFSTLTRASYMIEMTEVLFPAGVADSAMFELLKESLQSLAQGKDPDKVLLVFEARALALGGYAIGTKHCCVCGRVYTAAGTAVFKREKGAIGCLRCLKESALTPPLRPESVRTLEDIQRGIICGCEDLSLPQGAEQEIREVLKVHRDYRLEHRLKTLKYME